MQPTDQPTSHSSTLSHHQLAVAEFAFSTRSWCDVRRAFKRITVSRRVHYFIAFICGYHFELLIFEYSVGKYTHIRTPSCIIILTLTQRCEASALWLAFMQLRLVTHVACWRSTLATLLVDCWQWCNFVSIYNYMFKYTHAHSFTASICMSVCSRSLWS